MISKPFVFLCLIFAFVLLISSEVAARDLAETSTKNDNQATVETNEVEDAKYDRRYGGGGYDHGGRGGYGDRGGRYGGGGGHGNYGGGGGRGGGGGYGCRHGRCGYRCCSYAGEVVEGAKP